MRLLRVILFGLLLVGGSITAYQAAAAPAAEEDAKAAAAKPAHEEHGLPQHAEEIARPFDFPITNSMLVTWIVAVVLIVFAQVATRRMKEVPEGAQNFWEWMGESLNDFFDGFIG